MEVLRKDLNLLIDDFGFVHDLNIAIRSYHKLLKDYMARRTHRIVIHAYSDYIPIL